MQDSRLRYLFIAHLNKVATEAEKAEFIELACSAGAEEELNLLVEEALKTPFAGQKIDDATADSIISSILDAGVTRAAADLKPVDLSHIQPVHFLKTAWFRYAALIILMFGSGIYFWYRQGGPQAITSINQRLSADIKPGREGATLTLADGSRFVLDSLGNGVIATQNGVQIMLNNGQLVYNQKTADVAEIGYNTMTTPKGGQFKILLPDGTTVWLNAASSLKYPAVFTGTERRVEVTGEAYFEVATDKLKPFFAEVNNEVEVQVLGTSFNVNAYKDETTINTTLLEGAVRVITSNKQESPRPQAVTLKPGEQVIARQGTFVVQHADIGKTMAWKNGLFNFSNASLEQVMRQLARWYDIEVIYEKGIPDIQFYGKMSRSMSLDALLKALEMSKVHFRMEDKRRLVVFP